MVREIYLKAKIDWDDYDDVCDELLIEDSGILDELKKGVSVEIVSLSSHAVPILDCINEKLRTPEQVNQERIKIMDEIDKSVPSDNITFKEKKLWHDPVEEVLNDCKIVKTFSKEEIKKIDERLSKTHECVGGLKSN